MIGRLGILVVGLLAIGAPGALAQQTGGPAGPGAVAADPWTGGDDIVTPKGLPAIGKWMLTQAGTPSDWLGALFEGKTLREPINVIILDEAAAGADDAKARLLSAAAKAGYPVRFGHSTGYQGFIGGQLYAQLPKGWDDAFSNDVFEVNNNHGRIFGPHRMGEAYLFIAAFSREDVDPFRDPGHRYASFNRARDDFTQRLERLTSYKVSAFVPLGNARIDDPQFTTGDHDGIAVLVRAGK